MANGRDGDKLCARRLLPGLSFALSAALSADGALAREWRRLPLWMPVFMGAGIQLYFAAPAEPPAGLLVAAAALPALLVALASGASARLGLSLLLMAGLGFAGAGLRARTVAAPVLAGETRALVEGRVIAVSQSQAGLPRLLLDAPVIYGLAPEATPARVRITVRDGAFVRGLRPGDWISTMARLSPPGGPVEPGGYDFARAAWFDRLGGVGVAEGRAVRIAGPPPPGLTGRVWLAVETARARIGAGLRDAMGGAAGAFAAALTVGERAALPVETLEALRVSGLAHLLSISGLHMAMVCGMAYAVVRAAMAAPWIGPRAPGKRIAAVAGIVAGVVYLALSGAETPAQRAFVMATAAFGGMLAGRPAVTMRALALAALVVLALEPEALLSVGFQMSFAATLALVAAYETARDAGLLAAPRTLAGRIGRFFAATAATSLIAGLATAPFAAEAFNRVSVYGLPANLLGVPAMGLVVAPALALAGALAPLGLEAWPLEVAGWGVDAILWTAAVFAAAPGADAAVAAASPATIWLVTAGGLWLCLWRSALRLAGLAALALAILLSSGPHERPDALITRSGAVGVMTAEGRAVRAGPRDRFAAETWLRRDGDPADAAQSAMRGGGAGSGGWSRIDGRDGWRFHVATASGTLTPPAGACGPTDLALAPRARVAAAMGCRVLDRDDLGEAAALAVWVGPEGIETRAASGPGRLWSR